MRAIEQTVCRGGLTSHRHGLLRVLVANLTAAPRRVLLDTSGWRTQGEARTRVLDAGWAMNDPEGFRSSAESAAVSRDGRFELELGAHAVARIDLRCIAPDGAGGPLPPGMVPRHHG